MCQSTNTVISMGCVICTGTQSVFDILVACFGGEEVLHSFFKNQLSYLVKTSLFMDIYFTLLVDCRLHMA